VLCDLEGKSRKEVAKQLGLAEGTVASRLVRGRAILAKRLARYGLAVTCVALEAVLAQKASGEVPATLMTFTIKSLNLVATGQADNAAISVDVIHLTEKVVKTMYLSKLKTTIAVLLATMIALAGAAGVGLHAQGYNQAQPAKKDQPPSKEEKQPPQKADAVVPKALLKAKLEAAQEAYKGAWQNSGEVKRSGDIILLVGTPEGAYIWSVRWLNAQLEMTDKQDDRISAMEEHINRMKDVKKRVDNMTPGLIPAMNAEAAKWYLAEAEIWLAKEKAK